MTQITVYDLRDRSCFHRCNNSFCMWKALYDCVLNDFLINNLDVNPERITTMGNLQNVLEQFENMSDDDGSDDGGGSATTHDESVFERAPINGLEIVYETDEDEFS